MRPSIVLALLAATLAVATPAARADAGAIAEQTALAQRRAESAFNALSDRYSEIWARLSPADKDRFSVQERAWLNEGRWQEQRACVAAYGGEPNALAKASCQAEVTERRLARLKRLALARL
jgi:uncharacterized protein YecT (DUF1311 family)